MSSIPIACILLDSEQALRQRLLQEKIGSAAEEWVELDDGFALRFPADSTLIPELAELIAFERECCPFLRLELTGEAEGGPIWMKLRGPAGAKDFLRRAFAICESTRA